MISTIILTKNEEENIEKCIKSVLFSGEIILIDDFSTDNTIKIAKKFKTKIYKRKLNGDFSEQRNFALQQAQGQWVLFVDADEVISKSLQEQILLNTKKTNQDGFYIKRRDYFLGKELKFGETGNIKLLRLAKKNSGKWKRKVHEYWNVNGEVGELNSPIHHYPHQTIREFVNHINFYSTIHAKELRKEGKKFNLYKIIIWPAGKFIYNYIFRFGFLDGIQGFIIAIIMSFHSFLAWTKLWLMD